MSNLMMPPAAFALSSATGAGTEDFDLQLQALARLLFAAADSLCSGESEQVRGDCRQLSDFVSQLRVASAGLLARLPSATHGEPMRRQAALLRAMEARAKYMAGLRRWRRALVLRRSLLGLRSDTPGYNNDELSRWC